MITHLLVFVSFYAVAFIFHAAAEKLVTIKQAGEHRNRFSVAVAATIAHPSTIDSVKEFVVHIIVYSGAVIPAH